MYSPFCRLSHIFTHYQPHVCFAETEAELHALKAMVKNAVAYFFPNDPASVAQTLVL
jgi:hypothetical protein